MAEKIPDHPDQLTVYEVFTQENLGDPHIHAGNIHAADAEMALQNARDVFSRRGEAKSLWVVPAIHISATTPADASSFFDSAQDKIYRHPQFYNTPKRNISK